MQQQKNIINIKELSQSYNRKINEIKINIGYSALGISLPVFIAQEKGFFAKEKLHVQLKRFDTAQPLVNGLISNNIQAGGYTALPIALEKIENSGTGLYFLTSLIETKKHRISYMISRKKDQRGKRENMKGKKIGILPTKAYHLWLQELLKANNIKPSDVQIIEVPPHKQEKKITNKEIDFLFTNNPVATTILKTGIGFPFEKDAEIPKYLKDPFLFGSFAIRKDFADQNPEITKRIINALNNAIEYIENNPKKSKTIMKKYIPKNQQEFVHDYPTLQYKKQKREGSPTLKEILLWYQNIGLHHNITAKDTLPHKKEFFGKTSHQQKHTIFNKLNIQIKQGEMIGLFGINGAGKSTLLNMIAGINTEYTGKISKNTSKISYIHQKSFPTLLPRYTAKENIFSFLHKNHKGENLLRYFAEALDIDFSLYSYPSELSGGQQQIVAILRSLITNPNVLLLDEPLSALDKGKRKKVMKLLKEHTKKEKTTVIMCSHRGEEISDILTRAIILGNESTQDIRKENIGGQKFKEILSHANIQE